MYIERDLLLGIGSCDHGSWQVQNLHCVLVCWGPTRDHNAIPGPNMAGWRPGRINVPFQVCRQSAMEPGRANVVDQSEGSLLENAFLLGRG